ncbi:MAG: hypothetical protein WD768_06265 [Phycisphaeraceae bacterium]
MSTLGMGIAGSVAQSSVQAGHVSKAQHRARTDQAADARKVREKLSEHFEAVEEGDEANLVSKVRVDEDVPEHDHHPDQERHAKHEAKDVAADEEAEEPAKDSESPAKQDLYRHVDFTA